MNTVDDTEGDVLPSVSTRNCSGNVKGSEHILSWAWEDTEKDHMQ